MAAAAVARRPCTWTNGCCERHRQSKECAQQHRKQREHAPSASASLDYGEGVDHKFHDKLASLPMMTNERTSAAHATGRARCAATLIMTENRPLAASSYWTKTIALNALFAQRQNHSFVLVRPPAGDTKNALWCKVPAMLAELRRVGTSECRWLAFFDSDSYVREQSLGLDEMLASHGVDERTHFVLAREEPRPSLNFSTSFLLNTGVVFVRASARGAALLKEWADMRRTCKGSLFHRQPEQKCLERMLINHVAAEGGGRGAAKEHGVMLAPMGLFNSPWGRYVRHVWGGPGSELRSTIYDDELRVQGVWSRPQLDRLLVRAQSTVVHGCGSPES